MLCLSIVYVILSIPFIFLKSVAVELDCDFSWSNMELNGFKDQPLGAPL